MLRTCAYFVIVFAYVGPAVAEECTSGAVFSVENNSMEFVVRRIGAITLPSTSMPAFALELEIPTNTELVYAYGQSASYTFLTSLEFLESSELFWHKSFDYELGTFYRFMEDSGEVTMFVSNFTRCR